MRWYTVVWATCDEGWWPFVSVQAGYSYQAADIAWAILRNAIGDVAGHAIMVSEP